MSTRSGWSSWLVSILLHVLVVAVAAGFWFWHRTPPATEQRLAIEASVVMTSLPAAASAPVSEQAYEQQVEVPAQPPPEPETVSEPDPVQVAAELAKREAEAAKAVEARRVAEQRRIAEARAAAQRKAEQVAKEKADRDQKEREKTEREKAEREKAEQDRKQREQLLAEQARLQRESDLNAQIAAEERVAAARAGAAGRQYIAQIASRIESNWKRPAGATAGTQCEIRVTQIATGVVTAVQVGRCNRDETVRQSIEDAVRRSSPLPLPSDPALFDRNLTITFRPEN